MTALPHRMLTTAPATSSSRLAAALRAFWDAMRAAHHERIPF